MGKKGGEIVACVAGEILVTGVSLLGGGPPHEASGQSSEISIGLAPPLHAAPSPKTQQQSPANREKKKKEKREID